LIHEIKSLREVSEEIIEGAQSILEKLNSLKGGWNATSI
jgi:hypothetical protein